MYGAIREYKIQPGKVNELFERVRAEFVPMIDKAPGFVGYSFAQIGSDGILTTSTFESQKQAEDSVKMAAAWVKENVASLVSGPPRVTTGEIVVRHVVENAKAGYGIMRRIETTRAEADKSEKLVREGLLPLLSGMPGFASYTLLLEESRDRGAAITAFADRASAEAAGERALAWVKENMKNSTVTEIVAGDIKLRHLRATAGVR